MCAKTKMFRRACFAVALAAQLAVTTVNSAHADADIYRKVLPATAWIVTENAVGSGVLIDAKQRLLITNEHVVDGQSVATAFFPAFHDSRHISDPKHYLGSRGDLGISGRVVAKDVERDVALVQLDRLPAGITAVPFARTPLSPGDSVHSIGNPAASGALWVYTAGKIRAVYRKKFISGKPRHMRIVETDAPINPGDSGGPVVNDQGQLVAIAQGYRLDTRLVSYCVASSEIELFLASVKKASAWNLRWMLADSHLRIVSENAKSLGVAATDMGDTTVFIAKATESFCGIRTRRVFAVATIIDGAPSSRLTMKLLEQNSRTKLGGWVFERGVNDQTLVIFCAKCQVDQSDERLIDVVRYISAMSASLEKT